MKKFRIICLVLAAMLVMPMIASCGNSKVVSTVSIVFREEVKDGEGKVTGYETLLELPELTVEGTESNKPNVLQAAELALRQFEKDYELSKDKTYIASVFGHTEKDSSDEESGYYSFWDVTIDGKQSDAGRQSVTEIYEGQEIVYTWTSDSRKRQDTTAVVTTDPNEDTTVAPIDDTTDPEDEDLG